MVGLGWLTLRRDCSGHHRDLPPRIPRPMREKAIVVVPRAVFADCDLLHAELRRVFGDQRAQIDMARTGHRLAGELLTNLDTYLVAAAANRRAQMNRQLVGCKAETGQRLDCFGGDARGGAPPSRVKECYDARRMCDEYRDAIGHTDSEPRPPLGGDVTVSFAAAEPAFPAPGVHDHTGA